MEKRLAEYQLGNMLLKGFVDYIEDADILAFNTFEREREGKISLPVSHSELKISNFTVVE